MQNNTRNKHEILLGLTTTSKSDWRGKIEEMKKFGIKKIALFPTCLEIGERRELYKLLETIEGLEIPHVHLRGDMDIWELDLLMQKYGTKLFNLHAFGEFPMFFDYSEYKKQIYLENTPGFMPSYEELNDCAGLCVDFSHWEDGKQRGDILYDDFLEKIQKYQIGCCHVSAISNDPAKKHFHKCDATNAAVDFHLMDNLSELDYIKQYSQYLPYYVSLELENSFEQQLKAKACLEEILEI